MHLAGKNTCASVNWTILSLQLQAAEDEQAFTKVLSSEHAVDIVLRAGYRKPLAQCNLSSRLEIIQAVAYHDVFSVCKQELDQFIEGLSILSVLETVRSFPEQMKELFCYNSCQGRKMSTVDLRNLFMLQFSPSGSNAREKEEATAMHWFTYLQDCEGETNTASLCVWL